METQKDIFTKFRRRARHLFHQNHGEISWVVVSDQPMYFGRKEKTYVVIEKKIYQSHSSIKKRYPYILVTYE
jgi:hypothetical protein